MPTRGVSSEPTLNTAVLLGPLACPVEVTEAQEDAVLAERLPQSKDAVEASRTILSPKTAPEQDYESAANA